MFAPILRGKLAGKRWIASSGGKIARVLLGTYEEEQTRLFEENIRPGMTVFDVGAHAGYYTLLSSALAGSTGRVFAFEPEPKNLFHLNRHVKLNGCENVTVVGTAVGEKSGFASFEYGTGTGTGHLSNGAKGNLIVPVINLDSFCREQNTVPGLIKMDIEGAELGALKGASGILAAHHPALVLSTHGPAIHKECCAFLRNLGYSLKPINAAGLDEATEVFCSISA